MKKDYDLTKLSDKEAGAELARLTQNLTEANIAYYQNDAPLMSDGQYDAAKQYLAKLEEFFPHLKASNSPSVLVGAPPSATFSKVLHAERMLSLSNAFNRNDVEDFNESVRRFKTIPIFVYSTMVYYSFLPSLRSYFTC